MSTFCSLPPGANGDAWMKHAVTPLYHLPPPSYGSRLLSIMESFPHVICIVFTLKKLGRFLMGGGEGRPLTSASGSSTATLECIPPLVPPGLRSVIVGRGADRCAEDKTIPTILGMSHVPVPEALYR